MTRIPLPTLEAREYLRIRKHLGEWLVHFEDLEFGLRTVTSKRDRGPISVDHGRAELVIVDLGLKASIPRAGSPPHARASARNTSQQRRHRHHGVVGNSGGGLHRLSERRPASAPEYRELGGRARSHPDHVLRVRQDNDRQSIVENRTNWERNPTSSRRVDLSATSEQGAPKKP